MSVFEMSVFECIIPRRKIYGIGLAAQSARRQPKKQMRVWAKHIGVD
jgi:hypothetical protein